MVLDFNKDSWHLCSLPTKTPGTFVRFQGDSVDFEAMQMSYEGEEVSQLLPGMLYKGEYKSGSAEHWRGLFDAHDIVETIVEGTPEYYRELIRRTIDWWAWSDEMIVVVSPVATDGVVKVYLKMTAAHSKNGNPSVISHPEDSEFKLFYRTDLDRSNGPIVIKTETRIHLQSHWGSRVSFDQLEISSP